MHNRFVSITVLNFLESLCTNESVSVRWILAAGSGDFCI